MLLDPVRDQIEDLGRELQLGAWFYGLRWLRANPHPMVDVGNRGHREVGVASGADFTHCVTIAAIAPWTDARSWSLTFAIAEVNVSRSLPSSSDELNVGEL